MYDKRYHKFPNDLIELLKNSHGVQGIVFNHSMYTLQSIIRGGWCMSLKCQCFDVV